MKNDVQPTNNLHLNPTGTIFLGLFVINSNFKSIHLDISIFRGVEGLGSLSSLFTIDKQKNNFFPLLFYSQCYQKIKWSLNDAKYSTSEKWEKKLIDGLVQLWATKKKKKRSRNIKFIN